MITSMADPTERAEQAVSLLMRLFTSALLPIWGLALIIVGALYGSGWWIACGVVIGAVGLLMFVGSPLVDPFFSDRRRI